MKRMCVRSAAALFVASTVPLGIGVFVTPAFAASSVVSIQPGASLLVNASDDEANNITIDQIQERDEILGVVNYYRVRDALGTLTPLSPCAAGDGGSVKCPQNQVSQFEVRVWGENDRVDASAVGIPGMINGGLGNDDLIGGSGADTLIDGGGTGNFGDDTLTGGPGNDTADYSGHAAITGQSAGITLTMDDVANDGVASASEHDNVKTDIETVIGTNYADNLTGSSAVDRFNGGDGDDILDGAGGADQLYGGNNTDTVAYASHTTRVKVTLGDGGANDGSTGENDTVGQDIENATGGPGNDTLIGSNTRNTLHGAGGSDVLEGGPMLDSGGDAPDDFFGDGGTDAVRYSGRGATGVNVTIDNLANDGGTRAGPTGNESEGDNVHDDVENLIGTDGADVLTGSSANNRLDGGRGADSLAGGGGIDTVTYASRTAAVNASINNVADDGETGEGDNIKSTVENIIGGFGNDKLTGSSAANLLTGGDGDDVFSGNVGADTFVGGIGVDTVTYAERFAPVNVSINNVADDGESGEGDNVKTDVENLVGGRGGDTLKGSSAANLLSGGAGNDTFVGGSGADVFAGGTEVDLVSYVSRTAPVTVTIDGTANDGESGENDNVLGTVENVLGGSGADHLTGSSVANDLRGGSGGDTLSGRNGDDRLDGGTGTDSADGGGGTDTCFAETKTTCEL